MSLLKSILDKVDVLEAKAKKSPKVVDKRPQVNSRVLELLVKNPEKVWSSDAFAKEIGCTGAAVRQTKAWKVYQRKLQNERTVHQVRKGYRDENGNIEGFAPYADDF
jgi:translation elongation factor EF-4